MAIPRNSRARDTLAGKSFDIAGDELTGNEIAELLAEAYGKPVTYRQFAPEFLAGNPLMARLVELVDRGHL